MYKNRFWEFVPFLLFLLTIGGCLTGLGYLDHQSYLKREEAAAVEREPFKDGATIIEVYRYRSGTKPANYSYHDVAIVKNSEGSRLRVFMAGKEGVVGDVWTIIEPDSSCSGRYKHVLGELLSEAPAQQ